MVIDRKIERYVREVMKYLPAGDRGLAQSEITEMLRDMVRDHAGDKEPDILDARAVIEELGSPEIMAMSWLEARHDFGEEDESALPITGWLSSVIPAIEKISWKKIRRFRIRRAAPNYIWQPQRHTGITAMLNSDRMII